MVWVPRQQAPPRSRHQEVTGARRTLLRMAAWRWVILGSKGVDIWDVAASAEYALVPQRRTVVVATSGRVLGAVAKHPLRHSHTTPLRRGTRGGPWRPFFTIHLKAGCCTDACG